MATGHVVSIFTGAQHHQPLVITPTIHVIPGKGIEGDRFFDSKGIFSPDSGSERDITLIEEEAIHAMRDEYNIDLPAKDIRRNILTRGVSLNALVGKVFCVGPVSLRGIKLCEPCSHLEKLTQPRVMKALIHRGGLRAQILTEGKIVEGDQIHIPLTE